MALYELALMGKPSTDQVDALKKSIEDIVEPFGLSLGAEVGWHVRPADFNPPAKSLAAVAFFGGSGVSDTGLAKVLRKGIPILPIVSKLEKFQTEIPSSLWSLNGISYDSEGVTRVSTALLECVGLLPRQRRVFISYRRQEAREPALQLFDELSARQFDVFLDTHGVPPGEDFQAMLWHRLCDADVLLMLDTSSYFEGRWTEAEFGRALAKGISVLRVGWPGVSPSSRLGTSSRIDLTTADFVAGSDRFTGAALEKIRVQLETVRSSSQAVRNLNLISTIRESVERIGGTVKGVGVHMAVSLKLPSGLEVVVYPVAGVPTSVNLNDAAEYSQTEHVGVVYDHMGLHHTWLKHLGWLGDNIKIVRWIKSSEAAWDLADWTA
jgi:hypothetical protein